jgi:hypothetical protein
MTPTECVLPSGAFARVEVITVADICIASQYTGFLFVVALAERAVTLDGRRVTSDELLGMEYAEAAPIFHAINAQLASAYKTRAGVA